MMTTLLPVQRSTFETIYATILAITICQMRAMETQPFSLAPNKLYAPNSRICLVKTLLGCQGKILPSRRHPRKVL